MGHDNNSCSPVASHFLKEGQDLFSLFYNQSPCWFITRRIFGFLATTFNSDTLFAHHQIVVMKFSQTDFHECLVASLAFGLISDASSTFSHSLGLETKLQSETQSQRLDDRLQFFGCVFPGISTINNDAAFVIGVHTTKNVKNGFPSRRHQSKQKLPFSISSLRVVCDNFQITSFMDHMNINHEFPFHENNDADNYLSFRTLL